jgi:small-conductance mechanosensitive channel
MGFEKMTLLDYSKSLFLLSLMCLCLMFFFFLPAYAVEKAVPDTGTAEVSVEKLKEAVNFLEDPKKREAFLRDLKELIQAREALKKGTVQATPAEQHGEKLGIEILFEKFQIFTSRIITYATDAASWLRKTPEAIHGLKTFFSSPENRSALLRLLVDIGISTLLAVLIGFFLRRHHIRIDTNVKAMASKLALSLLKVVLKVFPYALIPLSLFVLFRLFPSFPVGQALTLLFFTVLVFYRTGIEIFRALLSPDEAQGRILPLGDEDANYFWVWLIRFGHYSVFYILLVEALVVLKTAWPLYFFIRGFFLVGFPIMISVFILQVAKELRTRKADALKDGKRFKGGAERILSLILRYWPIPAIAYTWAAFVFLISRHEAGFRYLFKSTIGTLIALLVLLIFLRLLDGIFSRFFAISDKVKARFPGLEEKTNRYIRITRKGLGVVLVLIGIGVIAQVWGLPVSAFVSSQTGSLIIFRTIAIVITTAVVIAVIEISQFMGNQLLRGKSAESGKKTASQKMMTLIPMITATIKIGAIFIGGIVVLSQVGVNTTPILAGAGIVGLAVGFGSQTLVKDLINGLFILFEESIRVGDYALLGDKGGMVESVGLRTVRLRDLNGNVHVLPNSSIETITNLSKDFSRCVLDVGVAYREDVDQIIEIMKEVGEGMRNDLEFRKDIMEPLEIFGLDRFEDSAIIVRARFTTKPLRQWAVKREFNRRIKRIFDERGIEIPFPHRTLYMGVPKTGAAPPLQVKITGEGEGNVD